MISVNSVYTAVRDLTLKGKSGYMSNTEFNQRLAEAQLDLQRYYIEQYERSQLWQTALLPFMVETQLPLSSGAFALPDDFQHRLWVKYIYASNGDCGDEPTITELEVLPIKTPEVPFVVSSGVRGPSLTKKRLYYHLNGSLVQLYPTSLTGAAKMLYIRAPLTATRAVTVDSVNDEENYTSSGTVDLEWNSSEMPNFVDLLCFYKGVQTRDSNIIEWLTAKNTYIKANN